jgi:CDP-diacylglycerol--serine O-phosphatidyltransferase
MSQTTDKENGNAFHEDHHDVENISELDPPKKISMKIYILPNLITTCNLFFGFFSIVKALKGDYAVAAYAIVAAAVFDLLDGRVARLTRSTSKFGAEYDSLCDLVSFGVAPALLLHTWALQPFNRIGWIACFMFVACGALRLARFNVQVNIVEKAYFQGLPIPMAAGIVASSVLAFQDLEFNPVGNPFLLGMTFLLAVVMVSNFRYRSFKDLDLKHRVSFKYLVVGVVIIGFVAYRPEVNLFLLFLTYATLGAVFGVLKIGRAKRLRKQGLVSDADKNFSKKNAYGPDLIEDEEET